MEGPQEMHIRSDLDPQDEQLDELSRFIGTQGLSGDEANVAYQIAMGVPAAELEQGSAFREEVYTLSERMNAMMKEHPAANRIAALVDATYQLNDAEKNFTNPLETIKLTSREKDVLRSIVERKRIGTLTVTDLDRGIAIVVKLLPHVAHMKHPSNHIANSLMNVLEKLKDDKIEIEFAE